MESKISKTLVDTLIDLQLDDAPLLVKKSIQADKCGSCNQFIPVSQNQVNNMFQSQVLFGNEKQQTKSKTKTRNFNTSVRLNSEGEERVMKTSTNMQNLQSYSSVLYNLPEIKDRGDKSKSIIQTDGRINSQESKPIIKIHKASEGIKSRETLKYNEFAERQLSNILNEELDKPFVNPSDLMRATNKMYEKNFEKKK